MRSTTHHRTTGPWNRPHLGQAGGTTLVEVMVATTMSVLLLGVLVLAMQVMHKHERQILASDRGVEIWKQRLRTTIEWDLLNSRRWNHRFSSLQLMGFTGRDASGRAIHTSQRIQYRFLSIQDAVWFVRESTPLNQQSAITEHTLLCQGVHKILIGRPEDDLQSLLAPRAELETFFPIPAQVRCVLVDAQDQPVVDFLVLRTGEENP